MNRPLTGHAAAPVLASTVLTGAAILTPLPVLIVAAAAAWVATAAGLTLGRREGR